MINIDELRPKQKMRIMDLVEEAGQNISQWAAVKGNASQNPKYCYEWCFREENRIILNVWFDKIETHNGVFYQNLNMREVGIAEAHPRKARAYAFDAAVRHSYRNDLHMRVVIQDRKTSARLLDKSNWIVFYYDDLSGAFTIIRTSSSGENGVLEGELSRRMRAGRKREKSLRNAKITAFKYENGGRVFCEVPQCGFDFSDAYGPLGEDYAEVHHLTQLANAPNAGVRTCLEDLAVVCSNCHAMIHRGGECRPLEGLILRQPT